MNSYEKKKMKLLKDKIKSRDNIQDVYPLDKPKTNKVIKIHKYMNSKEKYAFSAKMRLLGFEGVPYNWKQTRVDGRKITYTSNSYKLLDIYKAIQYLHKKYKDELHLMTKESRDSLIGIYNKLKDK